MLDYALVHHQMKEEDLRQVVYDHELIDTKEAGEVFHKIAVELIKHLEHDPEHNHDELEPLHNQPQEQKN